MIQLIITMNPIINNIYTQAKSNLKKIILTESNDSRIVQAAKIVTDEKIAEIIMVNDNFIKSNPKLFLQLSQNLFSLRQNKGLTLEKAKQLLINPIYFGTMMVQLNLADGLVVGANHTTQETFRPALQIIKAKSNQKIISSFFIMESPNQKLGHQGIFIFADCGLNINPNAEELAQIAIQSVNSFKQLTNSIPKVAMLSYSTNNSSVGESVDKVRLATQIVKQINPSLMIEGETQADAAIIPSVSFQKNPHSLIKGQSNVLIFPNLDAGNIAYKLVERLGIFKAYGPLTQGINKPINDLSRGCSVEDIVATIAITSFQSQN